MTPEEKWKRLMGPKTAEDYGLVLTEPELETLEEGRALLAELRGLTAENYRQRQAELMRMLGAKAGDTVERVRYGVLSVTALP